MNYTIDGRRYTEEQKRKTRKYFGLYVYELRSGDNGCIIATIEPRVRVNFVGSIITEEKLNFGKFGAIDYAEFEKNNTYKEWE